jgi:hypothetical protein
MKRIFIIFTCILLFLFTSCTKSITLDSKVTAAPTISMNNDGKTLFQYQGFIDLDLNVTGISKVEIKNPEFSKNEYGIPTLHKGGITYFNPNDVNNIKTELNNGVTYGNITFYKTDIVSKSTTISTVKLQYLIIDVSPDVKAEDIKRKLSFKLECYDDKNKKNVSQPVEITVP